MKSLLTIVLAAALALPALQAQDDKKPTPAERLLALTRLSETGDEASKVAFKPLIDQLKAQGVPAAGIKELEVAAAAYLHQLMADDDLKKDIVALYNQNFTEDELVEMLAFYDTPTGRKALAHMPKIMSDAMVLGQKHSQKYAPAFQEKIKEIVERYQELLKKEQEAQPGKDNK
jgi:hypothetical protein